MRVAGGAATIVARGAAAARGGGVSSPMTTGAGGPSRTQALSVASANKTSNPPTHRRSNIIGAV